jgi:uncharacterized membrane protein
MTPWRVRRLFPQTTLDAIERAITDSERTHAGEICFAVEGALQGVALYGNQPPRERAIEVFSVQRLWDTEHRSGVLIYVLLADHAVEIVADRGAHARIDAQEWESICHEMELAFGRGEYRGGALHGIQAVTALLVRHFPTAAPGPRELSDVPLLL